MEHHFAQSGLLESIPESAPHPLAALLDRHEALERLQRMVDSAHRWGVEHIVCYLDLEDFRQVNEYGGRRAGDNVLGEIASWLRRRARPGDSVAWMGSDEFAVLMEDTPLLEGIRFGRSLRNALAGRSFRHGLRDYSVSASVGLVPVFPGSADAGGVLAAANAACLQAQEVYPSGLRVATARALGESRRLV